MNRREFIGGFAAAGALAGCRTDWPRSAPTLRLGVMTDTHVGKTEESCGRVRRALEVFRERGCDLVINNGDIADHFYPTGYAAYRKTFDAVFAGSPPRELYAYAWHDAYDYRGHPRTQVAADAPAAFEEVRKLLKAPNPHTMTCVLRGYTFLVMPQFVGHPGFISFEEYDRKIAEACAANPGRPVFVVDHIPPQGTVYDSYNWGEANRRRILDRYPQAVVLCGHVHGSLRNDLLFWQGGFTTINAGCLQGWDGLLTANDCERKEAYGVLTVDVHDDRLVVRRWDVRDGSEIAPDRPWIVPLPFAAANAPFARGKLKASEPAPAFPPDAKLVAVAEGHPFAGFRLTFPDLSDSAMLYRVSLRRKIGADWRDAGWYETCTDYWRHPADRKPFAGFLCEEKRFESAGAYRISVAPVGQYGRTGRPLSVEAEVPDDLPEKTVRFESKDPMAELPFVLSGVRQVAKNGFYGPFRGGAKGLRLPSGVFAGPAGTRFRVTVGARTLQPDEGSVFGIRIADLRTGRKATGRTMTPNGDSGGERYVIEFAKGGKIDRDTYDIALDWGLPGRIAFDFVRVEKIG